MNTKQCFRCKEWKDATAFVRNAKRKDGLGSYCKVCWSIYLKEHYKNNVGIYREKAKKYHIKIRIKVKQILSDFRKNGCVICQEKDPCCMSAHHLSRHEKDKNIGEMMQRHSVESVIKELGKCICVCENCHRKIHAGKILPP